MTASVSNAQFSKSFGVGLIAGKSTKYVASDGSNPQIAIYTGSAFLRYHLGSGLTVGAPVAVGFQGSVNSQSGGSFTIGLDLPLTLDYNFGLGSTPDDEEEQGFGGFIGGGFSYTYSSYSSQFYIPDVVNSTEQVKGSSYGPLANAGLRASIAGKPYTLRLFYKMGLEKAKFKIFGGGIYIGL
jgi:hypothetical protein